MTDLMTETPSVGSVHDLDAHRTARVTLDKPTTPAPASPAVPDDDGEVLGPDRASGGDGVGEQAAATDPVQDLGSR